MTRRLEFELGVVLTVRQSFRLVRRYACLDDMEQGGLLRATRIVGIHSRPESWLGVPILAGDASTRRDRGRGRCPQNAFTEADERLLSTIASSMGVALENARLFDETKRLLTETEQRNAELAVINEIGEALSKQLDFDGIIEAVGESIRSIFKTMTAVIVLYDADDGDAQDAVRDRQRDTNHSTLQLRPLNGLAGDGRPVAPTASHRHARANPSARGAYVLGNSRRRVVAGRTDPRRRACTGRHRARTACPRTHSASQMSACWRRSRRTWAWHSRTRACSTKPSDLLTETNERAAELAIINSVQKGLAAKLDMQGMYDLVGDKIQEIFDAQIVDIGLYDLPARKVIFPYTIERGVRYPDPEWHDFGPLVNQFGRDTRTSPHQRCSGLGRGDRQQAAHHRWRSRAISPVRAVVGRRRAAGSDLAPEQRPDVRLQRGRRPPSDDPRSSLSVALENARLFDETQRLLTETNERAAELAIINSVQEGLAEKLDMQSMYELVGDKIQEIFDAQVVDIGIYNHVEGMVRLPVQPRTRRCSAR